MESGDRLRYVVWFCHVDMFDKHALEKGAMIIEDMGQMGFFQNGNLGSNGCECENGPLDDWYLACQDEGDLCIWGCVVDELAHDVDETFYEQKDERSNDLGPQEDRYANIL